MTEEEAIRERAQRAELAALRAAQRARSARWDLDIAVFLFAVLIIILILLFEGVAVEIVAPIGFAGLALVWLVGWRRGRQLYRQFYDEEMRKIRQEQDVGVVRTRREPKSE